MRFLFMASAALIAAALTGCGYKPLEAPCAMSEGGMPASMERPMLEPAAPQDAVQALFYAEPEAERAPPPFSSSAGDCGPLRPINAERLN